MRVPLGNWCHVPLICTFTNSTAGAEVVAVAGVLMGGKVSRQSLFVRSEKPQGEFVKNFTSRVHLGQLASGQTWRSFLRRESKV
jgi:hypothetical protein